MKKILILATILISTSAFAIQKVPGSQVTVENSSGQTIDLQSYIEDVIEPIESKFNSEYSISVFDYNDLTFPYRIDLTKGNQQAFTSNDESVRGRYNITLPPADPTKVGHLTIYIAELPANNFYYDIPDNNIAQSTYLSHKPWLSAEHNSTWKFEFESVIGSRKWYCIKATEYIIE